MCCISVRCVLRCIIVLHNWTFNPCVPIRVQAAQLVRLANLWLLHGDPQEADVSEIVIIDCLLRAILYAHWRQVGMTNPSSLMEVLEAVELSEAIQAREAGKRAGPLPLQSPRRATQHRKQPQTSTPPCPAEGSR